MLRSDRRKLKRDEAQARAEARDARTDAQQIQRLDRRPGNSRKERSRLERRIAKQSS